jgi:hypothetical protein
MLDAVNSGRIPPNLVKKVQVNTVTYTEAPKQSYRSGPGNPGFSRRPGDSLSVERRGVERLGLPGPGMVRFGLARQGKASI